MYTYLFPFYVTLGIHMLAQGPYVRRYPFICFLSDSRTGRIYSYVFSLGKPNSDLYFRAMLSLRSQGFAGMKQKTKMFPKGSCFISQKDDIYNDIDLPRLHAKLRGRRSLTKIAAAPLGALLINKLYDSYANVASTLDSPMSSPSSALAIVLEETVNRVNSFIQLYPESISSDMPEIF